MILIVHHILREEERKDLQDLYICSKQVVLNINKNVFE
jgi:hypothetical protein